MIQAPVKNLPASVRQRLLNIAGARGEPFQRVLVQYGLERLLYRISRSAHSERFVLKGALLFAIWSDTPHRPTMDVDLMSATNTETAELALVFKAILTTRVEPDGIEFLPDSVRAEEIRETHAYAGVRIRLLAKLDAAHIDLQVDIGFADAITPGPVELDYPTLLEFASPRLKTYPRETVVAEKFETAASLGMQNTRMKDFYDLWIIAQRFEFEGGILTSAIRNTFDRRKTTLPATAPVAIPDEFSNDSGKQKQWASFLAKSDLKAPPLPEVGLQIEVFLSSPGLAAARRQAFHARWVPPGPWRTDR